LAECVQQIVDPGIATLSEVLDPIALTGHLRVAGGSLFPSGALEEVRVRVLKHHIGVRCTLELGLRTVHGWHYVIGKVYRRDRVDIFQAMEGLREAGFGPQKSFSIPQPLGYLPSLHLLVLERVQGRSAKAVFKTGNEQSRAAAAERCARWLSRFQALAPKAGPVTYARDYLNSKSIRRCSRQITNLGGELAGKATRLLRQLDDATSSLRPVEMRAGHGDFGANQLILTPGRTVVVDWDGYDTTDPARDVGRFWAALRRLALIRFSSIRALDAAAETFLKTYLDSAPEHAERNLRFFQAAACLKLATHHLRPGVRHWERRAEAMLVEGLRVLEGSVRA